MQPQITIESIVFNGGNSVRYRATRNGVATDWYPTRTEAWEAAQ